MMNGYKVYKHTAPNGKVYIGITKQAPEKRWKRGIGYQDNPYFFKAIQKYGWDDFRHEILAESLTKKQAEEMEIRLIQEYGSANRENGYNIAIGGSAPAPVAETKNKISESVFAFWGNDKNKEAMRCSMRGVRRSDNAKKNISAAQKRRFMNPEERQKVSERQIGRKRTEDAKAKTSASLKAYYSNEENKESYRKAHEGINRKLFAKRVICIETGDIFEAVVDAERKYNIDHRNIIAVCRGKRKRAGGYCWAYLS